MRVLHFIGRQWLGILILVAIVVSAAIAVTDAKKEAQRARNEAVLVRTKAIEVCADTSGSAALVVAFKERVANAAQARGEPGNAKAYRALARGGARLIPLPADSQDLRDEITDLKLDAEGFYVLGPKARALLVRGCAEAYNPSDFKVRQDEQEK